LKVSSNVKSAMQDLENFEGGANARNALPLVARLIYDTLWQSPSVCSNRRTNSLHHYPSAPHCL